MDISRRNLLLATSTAALFGAVPSRARAANAPKYFIVVLANGGWDITYCLDPKNDLPPPPDDILPIQGPKDDPGNPSPDTEDVATFGGITVSVNDQARPNIRTFFEGDDRYTRCHVVNGIWTGSIAHAPCRLRMFAGSTYEGASDPATIFGYVNGQDLPLGTVDMSGLSFPGSLAASTGRIGFQSQIKALTDPNSLWPPPTGGSTAPNYRGDDAHRDQVFAYLNERAEAYRALRGEGAGGHNNHLVDGLVESLRRGQSFSRDSQAAMDKLTLGIVPSFDEQIDMAIALLQGPPSLCRSVVLNTGSDWDTHIANSLQHGFYDQMFAGLTNLFNALVANDMFEDTVVAVLSEMTRTPQFNLSAGKDHHAHTSALFFGGPVKGGTTSGATDDLLMESQYVNLATGEVQDVDPLTTDESLPDAAYIKYDRLSAGIAQMLGLDVEEWYPGVTPFTGFIAPT